MESTSPATPPLYYYYYGASSTSFSIAPQRNPEDECFNCKRKGHWAKECPNKVTKRSHSTTPHSSSISYLPVIRCACGRGSCNLLTSNSSKNPDRKFYSCLCDFFMWADKVDEFRAPMCSCGAGTSSLNRESCGPNTGRWFFACRIKKNHGACHFFQWADSQVNTIMNQQLRPNKGIYFSPSSMNHQVLDTEHSEKDISPKGDLLMQDAVSVDAPLTVNVCQVSCAMFQSEVHHHESDFWRKISAAGGILSKDVIYQVIGLNVCGWFGRLAFPPSQCIQDPPAMHSYCRNFPSFNPISVPFHHDISGNDSTVAPMSQLNVENNMQPLQQALTPDAQLSSGVTLRHHQNEIKGDDVSASLLLKSFGQTLLGILENIDPINHELRMRVAEATFKTWHHLSIDSGGFSESVKKYIDCASRLAQIEATKPIGVSSQELTNIYIGERARFEGISVQRGKLMAAHGACVSRFESLREEVSQLKDKLLCLEDQMSHFETETLVLNTCAVQVSKDASVAKTSMEAAQQQMEEILALEEQREIVQHEAQTALETARAQLQL